MSFRKKLSTMSEIKNVYVKPYMMPQHVAFEIVAMKRIAKEDNEISNVLFMKYKPGFVLQMWGDKALQEDFNEADVKDFQESLKSEKWYLVTYGKVGTNFPVKILDQQQLESSVASIYDEAKHPIDFLAKPPVVYDPNSKKRKFDKPDN